MNIYPKDVKPMKRVAAMLIIAVVGVLSGCQNVTPKENSLPPIVLPEPVANLSAASQADAASVIPFANDEPDDEEFYNEPDDKPEEVSILVKKSELTLELFGDGKLIGRFPIHIGANEGKKEKEGDKKTPEGKYYICSRKDETENTFFLGVSYPNADDAKAAYEDKRIDKKTRDAIISAIKDGKRPPWDTPLGGSLGIIGNYDERETTSGSIAISNENIEILWDYAQTGVPVEILP